MGRGAGHTPRDEVAVRALLVLLTLALGAAVTMPMAWLVLASPGSHALESGLEPGLTVDPDEDVAQRFLLPVNQ